MFVTCPFFNPVVTVKCIEAVAAVESHALRSMLLYVLDSHA